MNNNQKIEQIDEDQEHKQKLSNIQQQLHVQTFAFKSFHPTVQNDEKQKENYSNFLAYGKKIQKFYRNGAGTHEYIFYIYEDDPRYLQWISKKKQIIRSRIDLLEIKDIKDGTHWKINKKYNQNNILHIHTPRYDLVLYFNDEKNKDYWHLALLDYYQAAQEIQKQALLDPGKVMAQKIFAKADKDASKLLSIGEVKKIFKQLHSNIPDNLIKEFFQKNANLSKNQNEIDQVQFQKLLRLTMKKEEVQKIYIIYSDAKVDSDDCTKFMSFEKLQEFFLNEMGENYDEMGILKQIEDVQKIDQFDNAQKFQNPQSLSMYQFTNMLFSMSNSIFNPDMLLPNDKIMDRPLTDYFINSSHNTYLEANQLTGQSSIQAYINSLQKGCRCVELDIWDGSDGQPIIKHGFTFTTEILFKDVIQIIKSHGFQINQYPLILSFENHCSKEYQLKMAEIINQEIGNIVFQVSEDADIYRYYPSPQKLKNKIIIKGKGKLHEVINYLYPDKCKKKTTLVEQHNKNEIIKQQNNQPDEVDTDGEINDSVIYEVYHSQPVKQRNYKRKCEKDDPNNKLAMKDSSNKKENENKKKKDKEVRGINELQQYFTIFGCTFKYNKDRHVMMISSLSESKIAKVFNSSPSAIIDFHKRYLTRIYPSGMRFTSSNYDPYLGFITGSQIVALNQQTSDINMLWYMGLFQQYGGIKAGYVPKPHWMCSTQIKDKKVKPQTKIDKKEKGGKKLKKDKRELYPIDFTKPLKRIIIRIISAQQLNPASEEGNISETVNPFVQVAVKGLPIDVNRNPQQKTETVENNGFNPIFKEKDFIFDIYCPDLAQIYFQVFSQGIFSDSKLGWYSLPVNCMRQGFRVIPMWDDKFIYIEHSYIFAHITILDIISADQVEYFKNDILIRIDEQVNQINKSDEKQENIQQEIEEEMKQNMTKQESINEQGNLIQDKQNILQSTIKTQISFTEDKSQLRYYRKTVDSKVLKTKIK